ncbi:MAG TPA: DUF4153 domain-containing protein [Firmicutes bacterium]|nr:DUF4153 domain-containing protein [Candidatus Fermentithermobacillaceae bacterium]
MKLLSSAGPTLRRFWVPVLLTIAMTTSLVLSADQPWEKRSEDMVRFAASIAPGVLAAWCAILFWERKAETQGHENSQLTANLIGLAAAALVSGLAYIGLAEFTHVSLGRHAALNLILFLGFFVIPNYGRESSLEMYTVRLYSHAVVSGLFSAIMFFGLSAITWTISSLFALNIRAITYLRIWMYMAGVLAPFLFMAGIPVGTVRAEPDDYPKVLKNLVLSVLAPLLTAYTAILYVYFAKILITRQWPVGLVAHLVLWYSLFTTALLLFVWPLASRNQWAQAFSKYWIKAVLPLLLMMFVAIGIRINYYGITENRYYVLVIGLWLLGTIAYLNLKKPEKRIFLPVSLAIVVALSVVGPWSSFSVAKWSQERRLEGLLDKYGMIQNGAIVPSTVEIPYEDRREMAEVLFYFSRYHDLSQISLLPEGFTMERFPEVFGFNYYDGAPGIPGLPTRYFGYAGTGGALDISGYRYMFQFNEFDAGGGLVTSFQQDGLVVAYDRDTQKVTVALDGTVEWEGSFVEHVKSLKPAERLDKSQFTQEDMTFTDESPNLSIKVVITDLSGSVNPNTGDTDIYRGQFYLLVGDRV